MGLWQNGITAIRMVTHAGLWQHGNTSATAAARSPTLEESLTIGGSDDHCALPLTSARKVPEQAHVLSTAVNCRLHCLHNAWWPGGCSSL